MEKTPQTKTKRRRRRHRAMLRKLQRLRNLVDNVHNNLIAWLVDTLEVILIPRFEVSRMAKKKGPFLRAKTVRGMYSWRHYIFRQRLLAKAELVPGCTVIECDEPYTSKTYGACGFIH